MQDQLADKLSKEGLLKIIYKSSWYPSSGVVAGRSVDDEIVRKVKKALLEFDPTGKDKGGLYDWESTEMPLGFTNAVPNDYDDLKHWAIKLEILSKKNKEI